MNLNRDYASRLRYHVLMWEVEIRVLRNIFFYTFKEIQVTPYGPLSYLDYSITHAMAASEYLQIINPSYN